jgi:hypothetical protein
LTCITLHSICNTKIYVDADLIGKLETSYHVISDSESVSDDKSNADNVSTSDDESGNADSESTSDYSDSDSNFIPKHYFSKDKMPQDLREALRVSGSLIYY